MVALKVLFAVLAVLLVIEQGSSNRDEVCVKPEASLIISISKLDTIVQGKQTVEVTVQNICACVYYNVKILWKGYNPVLPVDPKIITPEGNGIYLFANGAQIFRDPVKFNYTGVETPKSGDLTIADATIQCS